MFKTGLESLVEKVASDGPGVGARVLRGAGGALAPILSAEALANLSDVGDDSGRGHFRTWLRTRKLQKEMGTGGADVMTGVGGAAYNPIDDALMIPAGSHDSTIAHEVGHKRIHETLGPAFSVLSGLSRLALLAAPATSAWAAASKEPTNLPGYLQAAVAAPALLDEAGASALALYNETKHRGLQGLANTWRLVPAFGTYASHALAPLAITKLRQQAAEAPINE